VLSDPAQRKEYDAVKAMGGGARFTGAGPNMGGGGFEDVFSNLFGAAAVSRVEVSQVVSAAALAARPRAQT